MSDSWRLAMILAVLLAAIGVLLHAIGVVTPGWSVYPPLKTAYGLWSQCAASVCVSIVGSSFNTASYQACQALSIIGLLQGTTGVVVSGVHIVRSLMDKDTITLLPKLSAAACFASFTAITILIIVWGVDVHSTYEQAGFDVGYSAFLCIAGAVLLALGGGAMLCANRLDSQTF
ncbi:uncharacterized protein LOC131932830 [Physella acuta]|uniref:uncharacterized protein LOC131932830 n=1 Tax=Physella acuta TaxID=109671 RepID=UPI0027DBBB35|nr:uncharacterized protein LOC131932830 [Physella acuta]